MTEMFLKTDPMITDVAILLFRLAIGLCFFIHGLGKLGIVGPGNLKGFEGWLKSLGIPFPELQARLAMACELLGGVFIATGFLTRIGLFMCFSAMVVAATIGHKGGGYLITNNPPGNEYAFNLAVICIVLLLLGPGRYSLDAFLF